MARRILGSVLLLLAVMALAVGTPVSGSRDDTASAVTSHLQPVMTAVNFFRKPFDYYDVSLEGALDRGLLCSASAAFVVLRGDGRPARRSADRPFLTSRPPLALAPLINLAVQQLETALDRNLFPIHLEYTGLHQLISRHCMAPAAGVGADASAGLGVISGAGGGAGDGPWVVFEVSTGRLLVRAGAVAQHNMGGLPDQGVKAVQQLSRHLFLCMADLVREVSPQGWDAVAIILPAAAAAAAASGFAAAVPLWYCFLCPAVLGLLAPLAINFGLGAVASQMCEMMQMDQEECFDLWIGVLGLGFILSILSSIPIFKVCKLYECAHPSPSPAPTAAAVAVL